ncbi:MAG: acyl-CoA reductase [Bacteroidetes bacterium]|nr:acyl-CoA reductase [Bacteroidota bacterium]
MSLKDRIATLAEFGNVIMQRNDELQELMHEIEMHNRWFTKINQEITLDAFANNFLQTFKMNEWVSNYTINESANKQVGLILAGNIPFVGMHDVLSVLISGNTALIKQSSKDALFFPWMYNTINEISDVFKHKMVFTDQLKNFDAVITTGSNNAGKYFEYYFSKYPNIIRKNRTSVAVISEDDNDEELFELGKDVFSYFGLGCRNVSKVFLPEGFEPEKLFRIWEDYRFVIDNNKYKNNYDYNRTLLLLNKTPHIANDFFMMVENEELFSPLATLNYEFYNSPVQLQNYFESQAENLQCIVSNIPGNISYGKSQQPELWEYADKVDTLKFLTML